MNKIQGLKKTIASILILLSTGMIGSCSLFGSSDSSESTTKPLLPLAGSPSKWDEAIDKHISEPQRALKLKQLGRQLTDTAKIFEQDVQAFNQKAMALNADYNTTDAQVQQLSAEFTQQRNSSFAHYRDLIFAMRSQVSADEWEALTK